MVKITDLNFGYNSSARNILENINFDIKCHHCLAILGHNGSGKSTLIKCMDNILQPQKGKVEINSHDTTTMTNRERARNIAYVSQTCDSLHMTVFDTVLLGRKPYITWKDTHEDREIVTNLLKDLKLEHLALRNLSQLSGGEGQKVMIARALAQKPKLLLLDEPTSNLDPKNQHEIMGLLKKIIAQNNTSAAIILHDLNLALRYCDRFLFLKNSGIVAYGGFEVITSKIIEKVYEMPVQIIEHRGIPLIVPMPHENEEKQKTLKMEKQVFRASVS